MVLSYEEWKNGSRLYQDTLHREWMASIVSCARLCTKLTVLYAKFAVVTCIAD